MCITFCTFAEPGIALSSFPFKLITIAETKKDTFLEIAFLESVFVF